MPKKAPIDKDHDNENVIDVLDILQEYQSKRISKTSSRLATLEVRKKEINQACEVDIRQLKLDGAAYIASVQTKIEELQSAEVPPESMFLDIAGVFGHRIKTLEKQLDVLSHFLTELSPKRVEIIEENSSDLTAHTERFEKAGKRVKRKAKRALEDGVEGQKLATEVQAYIKHYKHLVKN